MNKYEFKGIEYKSKGEVKIAKFLDELNIKFEYEFPISVIDDENKHRVWYPDFYLKEFQIVIEYFGLKGDSNYDKGIKHKKKIFNKCGIELIEMYKENINIKDLELIIGKIIFIIHDKLMKILNINENLKKINNK